MSKFNKAIRKIVADDQLNQRFNKALVVRQLKSLIDYKDDISLHRDTEKIYKAWALTDADASLRPRYFPIDQILGLSKPTRVLISEYSTMILGDYEFENFKISYHGNVQYAAPITRDVMLALGGAQIVGRILLVGGVNMLVQEIAKRSYEELGLTQEKYAQIITELNRYYLKELTTIKG